jgi:MarR family transcriptional regulator, lower aerobic nicotinate degradation pathway regulator
MNRYDLLRFFIEKIEAYEKTVEDPNALSPLGFNDFMLNNYLKSQQPNRAHDVGGAIQKDIDVSVLIGTLYRYVKNYSKQVFKNTTVQTIDEFTYLAVLVSYGKMTKSELIAHNVQEKTTGMEIIRRLLRYGFITQTDDPTDKRSQILEITEGGKMEIFQLFQTMGKVSTLATGDLTEVEKSVLFYLLQKLDNFHRHIYGNEKNDNLNFLIEKYRPTQDKNAFAY